MFSFSSLPDLELYLAGVVVLSILLICIRQRKTAMHLPSHIPVVTGTETTDYHALIQSQYIKVSIEQSPESGGSTDTMSSPQDKDQIYMLKTPFRQVFVLPPRYVGEYGWQPEHKVCRFYPTRKAHETTILISLLLKQASAVDLCERFLGGYDCPRDFSPYTKISYGGFLDILLLAQQLQTCLVNIRMVVGRVQNAENWLSGYR